MVDIAMTSADIDDLLQKTNKENPKEAEIIALRRVLESSPQLWEHAGNLAKLAANDLIDNMRVAGSIKESLRVGWNEWRKRLGSEEALPLECLLIDQVVLSWLRLNWCEIQVTHSSETSSLLAYQVFAEKRLNAAQGRYLRACETLARVRKIIQRTPALQVNIATNGGQQINVTKSDQ